MKIATALLLAFAWALPAQTPAPAPSAKPVGTMSELMLDLLFPSSNEIFYVSRTDTKTEADWIKLRFYALTLAESANLLMSKERAYDNDQWMREAQLLWVVADKAFKGAKAKDQKALEALNDELYEACQSCHVRYRPGYRRRP
jgi:cytochrome c556